MGGGFDLSGKTALVTGAGQGIGKGIARGLAGAGANVVIVERDGPLGHETALELQKDGPARILAIAADVTDPGQVQRAVEKTWDEFGAADILVNNVGGWSQFPDETYPLEQFELVFRLCVSSALLCSQAVVQRWIASKRGGKIINIASIYGSLGTNLSTYDVPSVPFAGNVAYASAKGAVVNLTRDLACAWARHRVLVNCISPGPIVTERSARSRPEALELRLIERIPLGRLGEPRDVAGAAVFLASEASDFVTGHDLRVDGGFSAW